LFYKKKLGWCRDKLHYYRKGILVVVHALNKFIHYGTGYNFFLHIDHDSIRYLMNKPDINGRIIIWILLLQQFDLTIVDQHGKHNVDAYLFYPGGQFLLKKA